MGDPFRRLFLDQVELIINREANKETVLSLLQLAKPTLQSLGSRTESDQGPTRYTKFSWHEFIRTSIRKMHLELLGCVKLYKISTAEV